MKKAVIIEQGALLSSLGTLEQTTDSLLCGISALQPAPCYNIPVAYAPFADVQLRQPENAFPILYSRIDLPVRQERILFIYAAAKGDIRALEPAAYRTDTPLPSALLTDQASRIAKIIGITPYRTQVISTACASGIVAVAVAKTLLENGLFSTAVIAGFDVISHFVTSGFHALRALSPTGPRPFDRLRDGLSLGDGAALAVLRFREPAKGDVIVAGADQSNDANHRTGPSPTGDGLFMAASGALDNGGIQPGQIGAVKCHGTATPYNDAMEAKAVNRLFKNVPPPCFSLKGGIGHTSGAGSLIELLLGAEFLKRRTAPPTINFSEPDPDAKLPVTRTPQPFSQSSLLCLSAGFGGLNAAVVLSESA
jgi:3-oxoacyl-(acyl-carrier-protein) synthase